MIVSDLIVEQDVWLWCSDAYLRHGIKLRLPECSDHTKTYQWRYIKSLTKKFNEWEFNTGTCLKFIEIAVKYAKELKVLNKGLSIFHQSNMLNICYKKLTESTDIDGNMTSRLISGHNVLAGVKDKQGFLLKRQDSLSFRNITNYYMSRLICSEYLALSKSANKALRTLASNDPQERQLLPSDAALYLLRIRILNQHSNLDIVKDIVNEE